MSHASKAKLAIRRRIAGTLTANVDLSIALDTPLQLEPNGSANGFSEDDVYLYPSGMSSIFNTHRVLLKARGAMKSISFG